MITVTRSPFFYEPVYQNSILFGVTSSLSTREDFRYGFELYKGLSWSGINESVVRTFAYPRPDGSGLYTPHEFLKDNLSYDVNPFILAPTQSYNSLLFYKIGFWEQYNPKIKFNDILETLGNNIVLNPTFSSTLSNWSDVKNVTWTDTIIGPRAQYTYTSGTYDGQITQVISCSASFDYSVFTRFNIFNSNVTYRLQVLNQSTGEFLLLRDFNGTGLREEGLTFNTGSATSIVVQIIFLTTNFATSGAWVNRLEIFKQNDEILITFPEAHPFLVGDEIKIDKDDKTINISYDGWAEVLGTSTFSVVVDRPVDEPSSFSQLGSIVGLRRLSGFSSNRIAYNGVRQYEELDYDFASKYVLSGYTQSEASFLTTYTGNKLIRKDEYETLSVIVSTQSLNSISIVLTVYDKDGLIIDTPSFLLEGSFNRWDFPVGYESVMVPLGLTAAVKWEVGCVFNANIFDNLKFTYILDESCLKYDPIRLCWLNKLGGIDYYTFTLKSKWRSNVTRKTIKRNLGLEYNVGDFNEDVIGQTIVENWSINSYWLTDDEGLWMRDLIESPKVWMIDGLNLIPIILTSDVYEFKSTLNDELVQYTIEFRKSNNIISNI